MLEELDAKVLQRLGRMLIAKAEVARRRVALERLLSGSARPPEPPPPPLPPALPDDSAAPLPRAARHPEPAPASASAAHAGGARRQGAAALGADAHRQGGGRPPQSGTGAPTLRVWAQSPSPARAAAP
eukprot:TRINITY_DN3249_c1_g1_i1.p5 TRINITY_DN3249_c1_g1~~TRINITY_DN3249_c1_g1_i1.p5  ORF type:complete len:128 (+),score=21.54 TRINITY_DN3249_c1_g1_i1:248-631(+)